VKNTAVEVPDVYVDVRGHGSDVVFLHGWGLHSGIWGQVADDLTNNWRVHLVDLPGHGRSIFSSGHDSRLEAFTDPVLQAVPEQAVWVGWSLGGMFATSIAANYPERVKKLVLVSSSPRFVSDDFWPHALSADVLEQFSHELETDYEHTLSRFLSLQTRSTDNARDDLRKLREQLFDHGNPSMKGLRAGLDILCNEDLRSQLALLQCPVLSIMGERDLLTPCSITDPMKALLPAMKLAVIEKAGHAPFLSHRNEFVRVLTDFIND